MEWLMRKAGDELKMSHLCCDELKMSYLCCGPQRETLSRPICQFCAQLMLWQDGRSLGQLSADGNRNMEGYCRDKVTDSYNSG
jgi:hypothetical protein